MSSIVPFDWHDGPRALKMLTAMLHDRGLTLKAQGLFQDAVRAPRASILEGFNLFDTAAGYRAVDWCVPYSNLDESDVYATYEAYVDRPLGSVMNPIAVARKGVPSVHRRKFFGPHRERWDWWVPAALLVAVAYQKTDGHVNVGDSSVLLETSLGRYEVTKSGCWVNFRNRMLRAELPARDADIGLLDIPRKVTRAPLAHVVTTLDLPLPAQWLANSVVRSVAAGAMPPLVQQMLEFQAPKATAKKGRRKPRTQSLLSSIVQAQEILEGMAEDTTLYGLYKSLVPGAISKQDFRELIGDPFTKGDREITETIRSRAAEVLSLLERREHCKQDSAP